MPGARPRLFYGWSIVAVAFVTMAIGVNARTSFSLLFPPILDEFRWDRGVTAGAFSFGFIVSMAFTPLLGKAMDRWGPRVVIPVGVIMVCAGLGLGTLVTAPWHLYVTLGLLVAGGSVVVGYTGHALYLTNWFVRRRGVATGVAFSGVGIGSIVLFPALQIVIGRFGWRAACWAQVALLAVVLIPLNLVVPRTRPEDLGLHPDGDPAPPAGGRGHVAGVVDAAWASTEWTLARAMRTARFWWLALAFFGGLFVWYAVQVHQTKYLVEIGFSPPVAAWALGLVGVAGIVGQIALGHLSDRLGREWGWTLGGLGFALCYALLLVMARHPAPALMYLMVAAQGVLGYGLASVYGASSSRAATTGRSSARSASRRDSAPASARGSRARCTTRREATRSPSGSRSAAARSRSSPSGSPRRARCASWRVARAAERVGGMETGAGGGS